MRYMETTKLIRVLVVLLLVGGSGFQGAWAQTHEASQLVLNFEKLNQLRQLLKDMQRGYEVLDKGYSSVRDITEGNFNLHRTFLDGLLEISPGIREYHRLGRLIQNQQRLVGEYRSGTRRLGELWGFAPGELAGLATRYSRIYRLSLRNLEELALLLTAGSLRMDDFERLEAIDRLDGEMERLLVFLRKTNRETGALERMRYRSREGHGMLESLYGLNP